MHCTRRQALGRLSRASRLSFPEDIVVALPEALRGEEFVEDFRDEARKGI